MPETVQVRDQGRQKLKIGFSNSFAKLGWEKIRFLLARMTQQFLAYDSLNTGIVIPFTMQNSGCSRKGLAFLNCCALQNPNCFRQTKGIRPPKKERSYGRGYSKLARQMHKQKQAEASHDASCKGKDQLTGIDRDAFGGLTPNNCSITFMPGLVACPGREKEEPGRDKEGRKEGRKQWKEWRKLYAMT